MFINKKIILLLVAAVSISNAKADGFDYSGRQFAQAACASTKLAARLVALTRGNDLRGRKHAACLNGIAAIAGGGERFSTFSNDFSTGEKIADNLSPITHGLSSTARLAKVGHELYALKGLEEQLGEGFHNKSEESELLSYYYECEEEDNKLASLKKYLPYALAIGEFGASMYCAHNNGRKNISGAIAEMVRAACDIAQRFACRKGRYKGAPKLDAIEGALTVAPHLFDAGMIFINREKYGKKEIIRNRPSRPGGGPEREAGRINLADLTDGELNDLNDRQILASLVVLDRLDAGRQVARINNVDRQVQLLQDWDYQHHGERHRGLAGAADLGHQYKDYEWDNLGGFQDRIAEFRDMQPNERLDGKIDGCAVCMLDHNDHGKEGFHFDRAHFNLCADCGYHACDGCWGQVGNCPQCNVAKRLVD